LPRQGARFSNLKQRSDFRRTRRDHRLEQIEGFVVRSGVLVEHTESVLSNLSIRLLFRRAEVCLLRFGELLVPFVQTAELEIAPERVPFANLFGLLQRLRR